MPDSVITFTMTGPVTVKLAHDEAAWQLVLLIFHVSKQLYCLYFQKFSNSTISILSMNAVS